jgi:hypothetical protein
VLVGATDDVGTVAAECLQRTHAGRVVGDLDVQPFGLEVAQLFRDGQGQAVEGGLARHGDVQAGLLQPALGAHAWHGHGRGGARRRQCEPAPRQQDVARLGDLAAHSSSNLCCFTQRG